MLTWETTFHWAGKCWNFGGIYNGEAESVYINLSQLDGGSMSLEELDELCEFLTKLREAIKNGPK